MINAEVKKRDIRVLFVDDEVLTCKYFANSVMDDYDVITANDVQTALSLLREKTVDIVVTDYRMPGVHGGKLLSMINQEFPNTVCIMATAYADKESLVNAVNNSNLFHILEKPVDQKTLKNVLDHVSQKIKAKQFVPHIQKTDSDSFFADQLNSLLMHITDLSVSMQYSIEAQKEPLKHHESLLENIQAIRQNAEYASQLIEMYKTAQHTQ